MIQQTPSPYILRLEKVVHCHKSVLSQKDCFHLGPLTLHVDEGEILAVVGPSGSGKTTFLRIIAGLECPLSGEILYDNKTVFSSQVFLPAEKRKIGMVFQELALFPHLTVKDNILFGIRKMPQKEKNKALQELQELLDLKNYLERFPHEISGGQQQRVALARTLATKPKLILLDEPLSNIDAELRANVAQELRSILKIARISALWVTHDQSEALDLADRILVLNEGKIEQVDAPQIIYTQPKTRFVADFVGHAVFIDGQLKGNTINTELGPIQCLPCLQTITRQEVMIRPDDVKAFEDSHGSALVIKKQFFGSTQLYTLQLPSGQKILTRQPTATQWPIGTRVRIDLDIHCAVAFPKE